MFYCKQKTSLFKIFCEKIIRRAQTIALFFCYNIVSYSKEK